MKNSFKRLIAFVLAMATVLSLAIIPAHASSITKNGSTTARLTVLYRNTFLTNSYGVGIQARYRQYQTNDGLTGPGYCVEHGQNEPGGYYPNYGSSMKISGIYHNAQTMGAFANGYPQRPLEDFLSINTSNYPQLAGLTEEEYAYATQLAIWATMGQLAVEGTEFTSGSERLNVQTGSSQSVRIYTAIKIILYNAFFWVRPLYTGMNIRPEEDNVDNTLSIYGGGTSLNEIAQTGDYGLVLETINGIEYITRRFIASSGTSVYPNGRMIDLWMEGAPAGTILVDMSNQLFTTKTENGITKYRIPAPSARETNTNENYTEYWGEFKVCIPADSAPDTGTITFKSSAIVSQYLLYYLEKPALYYQDCIIADPATTPITAEGFFVWSTEEGAEPPPSSGNTSLALTKTDGMSNPLSGVSFTLVGTDGSRKSAVTDASGRAGWTGLNAAVNYTLYEDAAPEGFLLMEPRNITLTAGQTSYVTVRNTNERTFTLKKTDAQNGGSLASAVFEFRQIDGSHVTTKTTMADGTIMFSGPELPYGSYTVREITAPAGYEPDTSVKTVHWTGTADVTVNFTNVRKPTIRLYKMDEDTSAPLSGVSFRVYKDGRLITTVTTNDAGTAFVNGVTEGYWEFEEVAAPSGYIYDSTRHGIYVDPYDPATTADPHIIVTNKAKPALTILKYDRSTMQPMAGVMFEVYRDTVLIGEYTTDANGKIELSNIDPGTYTAIEVGGPSSHVINSTPQSIEVKAGEYAKLVFLNELKPGIHIVKLDSETLKPLPNAVFVIKKIGDSFEKEFTSGASGEIDLTELEPGAYTVTEKSAPDGYLLDDGLRTIQINAGENAVFVFTNTPKPSLVISKYDPVADKYLPGATFKITRIADGSHYLDRVTDTNGRIEITGLEPGVYSVLEVAAPAGYVLNTHEYHVELFPGEESQVVVVNEKKPNLKIIKTDAVTGEPVPGVTFTVNKVDGSTLTTVTSDEKGECLVEGLDPGVYTVKEQSVPANYLLNESPQNITLVPNETGIVQFQNYPKPGLVINKIDSITGDPIKGSKFSITYASSNTASGETSDLGTYYTDENGQIYLSNIQDGWYKITELEPAAGYVIKDPTTQTVYVKAGENKSVTFENIPKSAIIVRKVDANTGEVIPETLIRLRYLGGTSGTGGTVVFEGRTSVNGTIVVTNLKPGTYVVEEVSPAPGYVMTGETTKTVYLSADEQAAITVELTNYKQGQILIQKLDADDRKTPIEGVEFEIRKANGERIGTYVTNASGIITAELEDGWYEAVETYAKSPYILDSTPHKFEVKNGKMEELRIYNKQMSGLFIHKTDSITGKGIYGVTFILYDSGMTPVMQLTTDQSGYAWVDRELPSGRYYVRELEPAEGYEADKELKTIYIEAGKTANIEWTNKPIMAQIQVIKYALDDNPVTGTKAGAALSGAVFEITRYRSGTVVGYITTDARGVAASEPLPLGRYIVREVTPPAFYQLSEQKHDIDLEYAGQIVKIAVYNKSVNLGTTINKKGNLEVKAGDSMRYDIYNIANTSNVPLSDFYWSDSIPVNAVRARSITTGTYSQRLYYRVLFRTNYSDYRVLASNLLSTVSYSLDLTASSLGLMSGEAVTEVRLEFGTVEAGFRSVKSPTITVDTLSTLSGGYQIVNQCDVGGYYRGAWEGRYAKWVTRVIRFNGSTTLPKTGY